MSVKKMRQKGAAKQSGESPSIPKMEVARFLQQVGQRAWTDAEKELDNIRQKSDGEQWSRGYVKALEGLLLTFRTNDDKYIYLPRVLATATGEAVNALRIEFEQFSANDIHGEYDRGYFKALQDFLSSSPDQDQLQVPMPSPTEKPSQEPTKQAMSTAALDEE